MDKIAIAKQAVGYVVAAGAAKIVSGFISNNTDPEKVIDKITITVASVAIGSLVKEALQKHTDAKIDSVVELWNKHITPRFETKED